MALLEVKRTPEGKILARRRDGRPLTLEDREEAKRLAGAAQEPPSENDPILPPEAWFPEFHRFHVQVVRETPNLDWGWLRDHRPDLFQSIRAKENELDGLEHARLSQVMAILREWRELVFKAQFEPTDAGKPQTGGTVN